MRFYLTFGFFGFNIVKKRTMNLLKGSEDFGLSNFIWLGLLLNFKSFTSFSYKLSFIKCLIVRSFIICNNWNSFHDDIENIKSNLIKNAYPLFLIDKVIKKYLDFKFYSNQNQLKDKSDVH